MSSTKRGGQRHAADYYVTPVAEIKKFLKAFKEVESLGFRDARILDPCAGGDKFHAMSYPTALKNHGVYRDDITTLDIREDSRADIKADYLSYRFNHLFDVCITNPPFAIAQEIVDKAKEDVNSGGFIIMLLRLNFFGSLKRREWWHHNVPKYVFVHPSRMSFTEDGKTDSIEYMHCVWQVNCTFKHAKLCVL